MMANMIHILLMSAFWVKQLADMFQIPLTYIRNEENGQVEPLDHLENLERTLTILLIHCRLECKYFILKMSAVSLKEDDAMV